ncbi:MAG: DNA polymerase III subunit gamma/tau [Gammaproteobacteria bacterium]|nr:DNA polymerase III subunit gamma/tau [Gammaproteobacteria bacterium]MYD02525.1 DNA polymerase III subunit gamma/tau [Gammaproteobacteria bacterium]MYI25360.1 DNA polymerase III subunit gamma/tau [Gammaproteobacteria bacterium]
MSYLVLARKWRPRKFSEVKGQPHAVRALTNAISAERVHHAWLFAGTRGVGKTTLARILAAALNCRKGAAPEPCGECESCTSIEEGSFVDLMEVDAASRTKVEQTRELLENVQYAPASGSYKIYLIDEAHMLSASSFNALLKTLEEPPPHVKFLLATTEPQRLPVTVLSRCLQINLRSMDSETISDQLTVICKGEGVEAEPGALVRLARAANGSMRDALSLLDQAIAYGADAVRETDVADMLGGAGQPSILHLLNALAGGDGEALLNGARELRERLADPANILAEMAAALQRLALLQTVGEGVLDEDDDAEMLAPLAEALPADQVQLCYEIAIQGRSKLALAPDPGLGLEMTLLRMLAFRPVSAAKATRSSAPSRPAPVPEAPAAPPPEAPVASAPEAPAAPAPEAPAALAPDAPEEDGTREEVSASVGEEALSPGEWPETVAGLGLEGLSGDIAEHSELVDAGGGCLRLRLDGAHENLLTEDVRQELESALLAALPDVRKVEIEIAGAGKGDTLAARNRAEERRRQQRAEEEFKADPFVQASLEIFDATIEVGSIRPVDQADGADSRAGRPRSRAKP